MRFKNLIRFFLISLFSIIIFIIISSVVLSLVYEKTALGYIQKYLNEHLETQISLEEFRFRILKGFPNATVEISNVTILSGKDFSPHDFNGPFSDTLLQADKVLLQFDVFNLLKKKFYLKKLSISEGTVNLLFDARNRHNLKIWTRQNDSSQAETVKLQAIELNSMNINYISQKSQVAFYSQTEKLTARGSFTGGQFSGITKGKLIVNKVTIKNNFELSNVPAQVDIEMIYLNEKLLFNDGKIVINNIPAIISGEYNIDKHPKLDVVIRSPKFACNDLIAIIPVIGSKLPKNIQLSGNGKINASITTTVQNQYNFDSEFFLTDCKARNQSTRTDISQISCSGYLKGRLPDNLTLEISHFSSKLGKGDLEGHAIINDMHNPQFQAWISSKLDLQALADFAGWDTLENVKGMIASEISINRPLNNLGDSAVEIPDIIETGHFVFDNVRFKIKNRPWNIKNIDGAISWNKVLSIDSLDLLINSTRFLINGYVEHLTDYLRKQGDLKANIEISSDIININNLLNDFSQGESTPRKAGKTIFPSDIYLQADIHTRYFEAGKFNASDVALRLIAQNDSLQIPEFSFLFPEGVISGNALISGNKDHMVSVLCNSVTSHINIQELFTSFNNFTQHFILDKNVKGSLNGSVNFFAQWDSTLKFLPANLRARADFKISEGELIQFDPMLKLSKYIDVDDLRHIRFSTLENTIRIDNRMVTIPEMAIHSTAFNITVSGTHDFDNNFDYRMRVLLSEVLFKKARKKRKEIDEFMVEETMEGQTTIPLIIAGTPDNYDVRFDRKRAFDLTRRNFGNDTGSDESGNVIIEWDETANDSGDYKNDAIQNSDSEFEVEWDDE